MDPALLSLLISSGQNSAKGLGSILTGLFQDQAAPYEKAANTYRGYLDQGAATLNPFVRQGNQAGQQYSNQLNQMQNPSQFLNNLIGQYQESPYNQFLKNQGQRMLTNQASAGGLRGSTPYQQAGLDYSNKISQSGLNDWLTNVLGLNTKYLGGQADLYGKGLGAASALSGLYGQAGSDLGRLAYGQEYGRQGNIGNITGGILSMLTGTS